MIEPIDIGDDPLPNNAQPLPEGFSYEDLGWDDASSIAQYGFTPQQAANRALTAILRPDFTQYYDLIAKTDADGPGPGLPNWTEADADAKARQELVKQQMAIDYLAGKVSWFNIVGQLQLSRKELGAITIADIRDLGA